MTDSGRRLRRSCAAKNKVGHGSPAQGATGSYAQPADFGGKPVVGYGRADYSEVPSAAIPAPKGVDRKLTFLAAGKAVKSNYHRHLQGRVRQAFEGQSRAAIASEWPDAGVL